MIWVEDDDYERTITLKEKVGEIFVPVDLTGCTVDLVLKSATRQTRVVVASGIRVIDPPTEGKIGYTPEPAHLNVQASPYTARWRVRNAQGRRLFPFPNPDTWEVMA
jgi:hypothetical protein